MILKASERGGSKQLATHLLNAHDNEQVEIHEIRGFVSNDVAGAFKESFAISKGTRCKNHLFSLSLNPLAQENVSTELFETTLDRIEQKTGLSGQPRVIVFHEKNGRRHAHCVWSRIDAESMTAKNLSHFKNKLQDISRELYLENDWKMPRGLARDTKGDPRNYSLAEWQQCKRMGRNAGDLKATMQDCWATSDNATAFQRALRENGLVLAKGDRRGHVAVTHEGEVLSIARYTGKKAKEIRARLGDPKKLPSVEDAKIQLANDMQVTFERHAKEAETKRRHDMDKVEAQRQAMIAKHGKERLALKAGQQARWDQEAKQRSDRINSGIKGMWQRISGQHKQIMQRNELEAFNALKRDRIQYDATIHAQMNDRRILQVRISAAKEQRHDTLRNIQDDQRRYIALARDPKTDLQRSFKEARTSPEERLKRLKSRQPLANRSIDKGADFER